MFTVHDETAIMDVHWSMAIFSGPVGSPLPAYIMWSFLVSSTKSKMAAKILWRMLELEPLYQFVLCLV